MENSETRAFVLWSAHGMHDTFKGAELAGVVDMPLADVVTEIAANGYALTWCDVFPVAVLDSAPEGNAVEAVQAWVCQPEGGEA